MRFFRKPSSPGASGSPEKQEGAADQLRAQMAELESEMADSMKALADIENRASVAEARAMEAIRAGDDLGARAALLEQQSYAEKVAAIRADLKVLRSILDECYEFANNMSADPPAQQ